jgi:hypothetical protein
MHPFHRLMLTIVLIAGVKQQLIFLTNSSSTTLTADAFHVAPPLQRPESCLRSCEKDDNPMETVVQTQLSRTQFIGGILPVLLTMGSATVALAADDVKGTKKDPAYEACLSQCMYTCTKPKGEEQKSRTECLGECKVQCATTKQQLMLGTPLTSSAP